MDLSELRVPDGIEPMVGFRRWRYAIGRDGASLFPMNHWDPESMSEWAGAESRSHRQQRGVVLGRALLAGRVIEHAVGYCAQCARIAELIPVKGTESALLRVCTLLDLPMGSAA
ncbi:MAG: hypothetical protein ACRDHM_07320 [Actinomycetota bacterium]